MNTNFACGDLLPQFADVTAKLHSQCWRSVSSAAELVVYLCQCAFSFGAAEGLSPDQNQILLFG